MAIVVTVPFDCNGIIVRPGDVLDADQQAWVDENPELRSRVVFTEHPTVVSTIAPVSASKSDLHDESDE